MTVRRWDWKIDDNGLIEMVETAKGPYVLASDYDALAKTAEFNGKVADDERKRADDNRDLLAASELRNQSLATKCATLEERVRDLEEMLEGFNGCYKETTLDNGTSGILIQGFAASDSPICKELAEAETRRLARQKEKRQPYDGPDAYCQRKANGEEPWCFMQCPECEAKDRQGGG